MILWLCLFFRPAAAIDINDHLLLELQGGERIEGWYLKTTDQAIVLSVPSTGRATTVPFGVLKAVTINDAPMTLDAFRAELSSEWSKELAWRADPPPHPQPGVVAVSGIFLAGTGHGMLNEWSMGVPMILVDAGFMSVVTIEAAGKGTGRADIFFTAVLLSSIFKAYAVTDGHRRAKRRRERLGLVGR